MVGFLDIKKYNFAEHMVFYIYVFGLINIVTALFTPLAMLFEISYSTISLLISPFSVLLISWYYKRCFRLTRGEICLKTILAIPLFGIFQVILMVVLILVIVAGIYIFDPEWLSDLSLANYGKSM